MSPEDYNNFFSKIKTLVKKNDNFLILTHRRPDGDALGSSLALSLALKKLGKNSHLALADTVPYIFSFLPIKESFLSDFKKENFDLFFILDCGGIHLTGFHQSHPFLFDGSSLTINIDHHPTNVHFGQINLVDLEASATSEIIYFLIKELGIEIDKEIASCLLCGIFTDTGSFQNQITTRRALEVSSCLLLHGAKIDKIARYTLRTKSLSTLRLWGKIMSSLFINEKYGLMVAVITREDLEETTSTYEDIEGITNFLNTVPSIKAVLVLTEGEDSVKGSLRTTDDEVDVSSLAQLFGGGGHTKAAGFEVKGRLIKTQNGWRIE